MEAARTYTRSRENVISELHFNPVEQTFKVLYCLLTLYVLRLTHIQTSN